MHEVFTGSEYEPSRTNMETQTHYHLAALTKFNSKQFEFFEKILVRDLCCLKSTVFDCIEVTESHSWKWMTL